MSKLNIRCSIHEHVFPQQNTIINISFIDLSPPPPHIQNTVVGVSVLTLSAIAVERYFAICRPLKSRITMRKVTVTVFVIWLISAAMGSPNITNTVDKFFKVSACS